MKRYTLTVTIFLFIIFFLNFSQNAKAQAGTLDQGFGTNGVVPTLILPNQDSSSLSDAALQTDGKIVVAGGVSYHYGTYPDFQLSRFMLARYKTDGTLDPEFGTNGVSAITFGYYAGAGSVSILPDGKILAVGGMGGKLVLARYNADGSLDTSFGANGIVVDDFALPEESSSEYAVESFILPDNKILVIGKKLARSALYPKQTPNIPLAFNVFIARYNSDGTPDITFGQSGRVMSGTSLLCGTVDSASMQADGKILVSSRICKTPGIVSEITRYNSNGSLDTGFGQNGVVRFPPADDDNYTKILPTGEIMVLLRYNIMLLNADGSFNRNILTEPVSINGKEFFPFRFELQPDGRIIVLGTVQVGSRTQIAIARFHASGQIDKKFADNGIFYRQTNSPAMLYKILIQPDGKIIGVRGPDYTSSETTLLRLLGNSPAPAIDRVSR